MIKHPWLSIALLGCFSCGSPQPSTVGPTASESPPRTEAPTPTLVAPAAPDAGPPQPTTPATSPPPPAPVTRSGKVWPFHAWDRAEAVTFNQFQMRPKVQTRAYDDNGWSTHLVDRKPINDGQAKKAVELVIKTEGDVSVSKCPFPRHAVVLYERDVPVASINVCFTCGDIVLWPQWGPGADWDSLTDKELKAAKLRSEKQMKVYEKVFPNWKTFFRDEIGFPIDATYH